MTSLSDAFDEQRPRVLFDLNAHASQWHDVLLATNFALDAYIGQLRQVVTATKLAQDAYAQQWRDVLAATKLAQDAYAQQWRDVLAATKLAQDAYAQQWRDATKLALSLSDLAAVLTASKMDTSNLAAQILAGANFKPVAHSLSGSRFTTEYQEAAAGLLSDLVDADPKPLLTELPEPTGDSAAYDFVERHAPQLAEKIDAAAATVQLPFYSHTLVRDAFATLVVSLVVVFHVGGTLLPPPLNLLLAPLLGMSGVSVPAAYHWSRSVTEPPQGDASPDEDLTR